jgi:hypothetical protein
MLSCSRVRGRVAGCCTIGTNVELDDEQEGDSCVDATDPITDLGGTPNPSEPSA